MNKFKRSQDNIIYEVAKEKNRFRRNCKSSIQLEYLAYIWNIF